MLTILRVMAVVSVGLLAGIFVGYRLGVQYALPELSASSLVQLQQIIQVHYVRFTGRVSTLCVAPWQREPSSCKR